MPHLNSFSSHHGVSIRPFAAEDCFMKLFAIKRALMLMMMMMALVVMTIFCRGCLKKLLTELHLLLEVNYTSLELISLLQNVFYCLLLTKTEQGQALPSDIISLAKFGSNLGYDYGPIIILATILRHPGNGVVYRCNRKAVSGK